MPAPSVLLELSGVSAAWDDVEVVRSVSFSVAEGELLTLLGPNGSGKSTLLRAIAGFQPLTAGTIRLSGRDLARVPPHRRSIGLLFQEPTLLPRRSVYDNIAYGPLLAGRPERDVREEVADLAHLLELESLLDRAPVRLSGGERQRVALARSLAARPRLILLDEPFASVDPELRGALHGQFRRALRARGTSAIHVTHDREEGLFLGDRVVLLFDGSVAAVGPPAEVFARPATGRVARFLGYNVLRSSRGTEAVLPEDLRLDSDANAGLEFTVLASGWTGRQFRAVLRAADTSTVELRSAEPLPSRGSFRLSWTRSVRLPEEPVGPAAPQSPRRDAR